MAPECGFGLIVIQPAPEKISIVLKDVVTCVEIRGFVAKVTSVLTYINESDTVLQVEYICPIDEGAAVYKFEAELNGRKIVAHCLEKKTAEKIYKEAVESGVSAVMAREDEQSGDILNLALGNLDAGNTAVVTLAMVMELKVLTDGGVTFRMPSVMVPRYCPADVPRQGQSGHLPSSTRLVQVPVAYSISMKAQVSGGHQIARVISHTDAINVTISSDELTAYVTQDSNFEADHDWSLVVYYRNAYEVHVLRELGDRSSSGLMKDDLIMVNLFPEVPISSCSSRNEIIIIVDRSGSMQGEQMQSARATLLLFLKSLPPGCLFNVISFGSHFEVLFKEGSLPYTEETLKVACALQDGMDADMGGTEILQPLEHVYSQEPKKGYPRQLIVLTDGEVFNVDQVLQLISRHAHDTRAFAVGIGHGASTALVKGIARAGKGRAEMVVQQDMLQAKVMGLVASMLQENVQHMQVTCQVDPPTRVALVPKVPPVIFGGQHLLLYARVPTNTQVKEILIEGEIGSTKLLIKVEGNQVKLVHDQEFSLHRLAARAQLNQWQLEANDETADDMVSLSVSSGVICRRTALVGIDQDGKTLKTAPPPVQEPPMHFLNAMSSNRSCLGPAPMMARCDVFKLCSKASVSRTSLDSFVCNPVRKSKQMHAISKSQPDWLSQIGGGYEDVIDCDSRGNMDDTEILVMDESDTGDQFDGKSKKESDSVLPPFELLVNKQKFDGSWQFEDVIVLCSELKEMFKKEMLTKELPIKDDLIWGTVVALALLEIRFQHQKDQWLLMANKARTFVSGKGHDLEVLLKKAKDILQTA